MKKNIVIFSIFIAVSLGNLDLIAQPPPPALPSDVTQAPIDGGLSILALSGGLYMLKKLKAKK
jgi:hypothetical protein